MAIIFAEDGWDATDGAQLWGATSIGTPTQDTVIKNGGRGSTKCNSGAGNAATYVRSRNSLLTQNGRLTMYRAFDALPGSDTSIIQITDATGGTNTILLRLRTSGKVRLASGLQNGTDSTNTFPTNSTMHRICIAWNVSSATANAFKLWIDGNLEITETNFQLDNATMGRLFAGWIATPGANKSTWIDDVVVDDDASLTDTGDWHCTAKLSGASNVLNFDTTLGTGAVNERPLSETNGYQHAGTGAAEATFAIQSAADGDIDLTGATVVGYMGWVWARKGSGGGTPTDKIALNGAESTIALTTTSAVYTAVATTSTYPANAQGIGIHRTVGAAPDCFLYECGVVMVYMNPLGAALLGIPNGPVGQAQMQQLLAQ